MHRFAEGRVSNDQVKASLAAHADPMEWLRFALEARDAGDPDHAKDVLGVVMRERPLFAPAFYELAFLKRLDGDHRKAASLLSLVLAHDPKPFRTRLFLAHMLHASGAHREADATLAAVKAGDPQERADAEAMHAFGRYLERNPLGRSLVLYDRLLAKNTWLDNAHLYEEISSAIAQRRPYAMIRMGDGEGGVLELDGWDEAEYRPLYDRNRQDLIAMWFGHAFAWRTNGFFEVASGLMSAIDDCDVIGIPYEGWIKHEYAISSLRGVPSLVNVLHAFSTRQTRPRRLSSQLAHVELMKSGNLAKIIAAARSVSVISCLDSLPEALKTKFDLEDVKFYRIPGEKGSTHILGEKIVLGNHFPDRFRELQEELSHDHAGRVFLIAGGLLGKIYAATIKRFGGIAIDIGSVADSWAGHATRPGYTAEDAIVG